VGKKQHIKELEHELAWFTTALIDSEKDIEFLYGRIDALETIVNHKQDTIDSLKALNDSLLEILDSLPD